MPNAILSRPGVSQGVTDGSWEQDNANFLKIFTGEVLTAFKSHCIMSGLHRERTITHGKSATFPVTGRAEAFYHVPGTPILGGNQILHGEKEIVIDDLLVAPVTIYNLDEAKNHYDVRSIYSAECGEALAKAKDKKCLQVALLAAREAPNLPGLPGGSVLTNAAYPTDGEVLGMSLFTCSQVFDEKDVAEQNRVAVFRPAQYHLLASTVKLLNSDWGGKGAIADGTIFRVAGIDIKKSNHLPNTAITATKGENNKYDGDFSNTIGSVFHRDAFGTVKLKDLAVQKTSGDYEVVYQATMLVAKYAMGHGILRPECAIELAAA